MYATAQGRDPSEFFGEPTPTISICDADLRMTYKLERERDRGFTAERVVREGLIQTSSVRERVTCRTCKTLMARLTLATLAGGD
jgi:hypothetical protein